MHEPGGAEARRRGGVALVAGALCLGLCGVLASGHGDLGSAVLAVVCALTAALLRFTRVPLGWVDRGLLLAFGTGLGVALFRTPPAPTSTSLLPLALLALGSAAFAVLRVGEALRYAALLFGLFALASWQDGPGVLPHLIAVGLTLALVGAASGYIGRFSAERAEAALMRGLARTDALTGADNRPELYAHLRRALAGGGPGWGQERNFAVVLLDLDYFEQVNTRYGHAVGDALLVAVARSLRQEVRAGDRVARWDGDAFLALLPGVDERGAKAEAYRLWLAVRRLREPGLPQVTASLGVALSTDAHTLEDLLQLANERLYVAKASGRDRVSLPEKPLPLFP